jgi:glutaredoxin-related protein
MYFMDFRNLDTVGEPIIVHVKNEGDLEDIKITKVADNFKEFLEMVLSGKLSE